MKRKLLTYIIIILIVSVAAIYFYFKEKSYEYEYEIDKFTIIEKYDVDNNYYTYEVKGENKYNFNISGEYSTERGLITILKEKDNCLEVDGSLKFYEICKNDSIYEFKYEIEETNIKEEYNNIKIYDYFDYNFLIWNYSEFIKVSEDNNDIIDLLDKDVYNPSLILNLGNELFIPNYDEEYYFSSYFLIDFETGKTSKKDMTSEINFDLTYTKYEDDKLTIYDNKNNKEFDITLKNGDIKTRNKITYSNNELNNMDLNIFTDYYSVEDNKLKYKIDEYEIWLNDLEVNSIIYQKENDVIFLIKNKLYHFNPNKGVTLLLESKEWEFNNNNIIFVN